MRSWLVIMATMLAACAPPAESPPHAAPIVSDAPAGEYTLDPSHASVEFRVNHIGMSHYTARFTAFEAALHFDPADPEAMNVNATIDARSLTLPSPPMGFTEEMLGPHWLGAAQFPQINFRSTRVEHTGNGGARITGDLTLHGITAPVVLDATFNGGYAGHQLEPNARIGFSAHGVLKRSDFGVALGIPAPGTTMGVSDEVEVIVEAEFTGPPWVETP